MQKGRVVAVGIGAVLCLGALAVVQNRFTKNVKNEAVGPAQTTLENRAVPRSGEAPAAPAAPTIAEVTPESNVRPTVPKRVYTANAMRDRIQAPTRAIAPPPPPLGPYMVETIRIDPPIPPAWQPPPNDQRPLPR
jgi:hypothetical protein